MDEEGLTFLSSIDKNSKLIELIQIFREKISKVEATRHQKDSSKAAEFRKKGNDLFAKSNYEDACEMYTQGILHAPTEEPSCEEFALNIANRSACYFHLKKWRESITDVDLAISHGYPVKSRVKLIGRKASCENELKKLITHDMTSPEVGSSPPSPQSVSNDSSGFQDKRQEVDLLQDRKFTIKKVDGRGKCLVATDSLTAGSIILAEKAFMSAIHSGGLDKYCYHCLKKLTGKTSTIFPCKSCTQVRYCSTNCSTLAYNEYHKVECGLLELMSISPEFHYSPKITLKALVKYRLSECLAFTPLDDDVINLNYLTHGYSAFMDMVEHPNEDPNDYTLASALITGLLLEKTSSDVILGKSSIVKLSERIIQHLRQVNVNAITILSKEVIRNEEAEAIFSESIVGVGVYLTARLINHSCDPNCRIVRFDQDKLFLMATRDIPEGEELTISYGGSYKWQPLSKRKSLLKSSYFFDCSCQACKDSLQPLTTALLCPECSGPVTSDGKMICLGCHKEDHIDVKSVIANTSAVLKIVQLAESIMSSSGQNNFELAEKTLDEAELTLSKIVYRSHNELSKIWEKKMTCSLRLKKYKVSVDVGQKILDHLRSQYDDTYFKVFNAILTLVKCQSLYYKLLKSTSPIDKNELNLLKTQSIANIDRLDELYKLISSGDDSVIRERIMSARRLLVPANLLPSSTTSTLLNK